MLFHLNSLQFIIFYIILIILIFFVEMLQIQKSNINLFYVCLDFFICIILLQYIFYFFF